MEPALFSALARAMLTAEDVERAAAAHPTVDFRTLLAIWSQTFQLYVRKNMQRLKEPELLSHVQRYERGEGLVEIAGSIPMRHADGDRVGHSPCMLARAVLTHRLKARAQDVTEMLRDPARIEDARLRTEVQRCVAADPHYAPQVDVLRRMVGLEYEFRLAEQLRNSGVPFLTQGELQERGHAKTPDVCLLSPISVRGRVVNWIDSKAMFGDEYWVAMCRSQFSGYVNRFGPGLAIFWFGFVKGLDRDPEVLFLTELPEDIETLARVATSPPAAAAAAAAAAAPAAANAAEAEAKHE